MAAGSATTKTTAGKPRAAKASSGKAKAGKAAGSVTTRHRSRNPAVAARGARPAKKAQPQAIPMEMLEHCAACLKVLAHPHRLKMVELLADHDYTVGELAAELALAPAAVSQHLSLMKAHGLLSSSRKGKEVYYNVANPQAINVIDCIRKHMQA